MPIWQPWAARGLAHDTVGWVGKLSAPFHPPGVVMSTAHHASFIGHNYDIASVISLVWSPYPVLYGVILSCFHWVISSCPSLGHLILLSLVHPILLSLGHFILLPFGSSYSASIMSSYSILPWVILSCFHWVI